MACSNHPWICVLSMPISTWEWKYFEAVKGYFESPDEKFLLDAADIGRGLVQEDIPPEDIAEMHEKELKRFETFRKTGE